MLGMLASNHEGERLAALRGVAAQLKKLKLSWVDVGQALMQRDALLAAAQQLKTERDAARGEVERLKLLTHANGVGGTLAQALWTDTAMPPSITNRHATWLLNLAGQNRIHLTAKELNFVKSCARWRGRLTDAQRPWLEDIIRTVIARTGETPPP
jgi:hypothetical protein